MKVVNKTCEKMCVKFLFGFTILSAQKTKLKLVNQWRVQVSVVHVTNVKSLYREEWNRGKHRDGTASCTLHLIN